MEGISSWRDLLKVIISNSFERERIAQQMGIHPVTLSRWAQGFSVPRPSNLTQLLQNLSPDARKQFAELLGPLNPNPDAMSSHMLVAELDARFIMEVHNVRETTSEIFHFYNISHMIFQHALRLLDPERNGLLIRMMKCMPPSSGGKIRSLRLHMTQGTLPQENTLQEQPIFLGAESLAGCVVTQCRPRLIDTNPNSTPPQTNSGSVLGCPILYANRVAGCLSFFSPVPNYFQLPARRALVLDFGKLISLAFKPEEFYPAEAIELYVMPPVSLQQQRLVSFQQHVVQMVKEASQNGSLLTAIQAEELTWQLFEAKFIEASYQLFSAEIAKQERRKVLL